jgi:hypothetical protein
LAGAERYAASKPEPQFTAHASTWLNADRWLDEDARKVIDFQMSAPRSWAEIKAEREKPPAELQIDPAERERGLKTLGELSKFIRNHTI